jgi:carboxyl-terminal processing protease
MGDGSNIKMTLYKWLTPNGNWIHKKGITPDIAVDQPDYFKVAPLSKKSVLKYDANNDDVKNLQVMLKGLGIPVDRTDGYFSEKTAVAVRSFQRDNGLTVTGEVDADTAGKIEQAIVQKIKDPNNDLQLKAAVKELQSELTR